MFRSIMLVLLVLAAPFSAQALDCTGLDTLVCSGPTLQGTIGLPPEADYTTCGDTFPHHYKLYNVALVIFHKHSPPISTVFPHPPGPTSRLAQNYKTCITIPLFSSDIPELHPA